jgi:hypothetical protein
MATVFFMHPFCALHENRLDYPEDAVHLKTTLAELAKPVYAALQR